MKNRKVLLIAIFLLCAAAVTISVTAPFTITAVAAENGSNGDSDTDYYNGKPCAAQQVIIVYESSSKAQAYAIEIIEEPKKETAEVKEEPTAEAVADAKTAEKDIQADETPVSAESAEPTEAKETAEEMAPDAEDTTPTAEPSSTPEITPTAAPTPTAEPKQSLMGQATVMETRSNTVVVEIDEGVDIADFIAEAQDMPGVKYAQPNYIYTLAETVEDPHANINSAGYGWYLHTIKAFDAWEYGFGSSDIVIGVIDTGVDTDHEDLAENIVGHWDTFDEDENGEDVHGHGTMVSGYIAAAANGIGGCGVAPNCKLIVVDAYNDELEREDGGTGGFLTVDIVEAIDYLIEQGVEVINMSLGGDGELGEDSEYEEAINRAYNAGIVVVVAAGNDGSDHYYHPSDFENVISVMASDINDDYLWTDSNYGTAKDISAPGVDVGSTYLDNQYASGDGTSFASPIVAGAAALMLSMDENLSPAQVAQILYDTADPTCTQKVVGGTEYGAGRLNVHAAVQTVCNSLHVTNIEITPEEAILSHNDEPLQLTAVLTPTDPINDEIIYTSSNEAVATVSTTGLVTPDLINEGIAIITATTLDGGYTDTCTVTVVGVKVESVELDCESQHIDVGENITINATVLPENATTKNVVYESSNEAVATVNNDGEVTGIGLGECTITVTTVEGGHTDTCEVAVGYHVTGVSVVASAHLDIDETLQLVPVITPENATNKNVTYISADSAIATVSTSGLITAASLGTTTITVRSVDGGIEGICTVDCGYYVESVSLSPETMQIEVGDNSQVTPAFTPANSTNKSVTYASGDESIATVDAVGVVWGHAPGTVTITVTTADGGHQDTASVTVVQLVTGVTLEPESHYMAKDTTFTLTTTVLPGDATNKGVTYSSSNEAVATVSTAGVISAHAKGDAVITVTTNDGGFADTCDISVVDELITSNTYLVNREEAFFENVAIDTSVQQLIASVNNSADTIRILDCAMKEVTSGNVSTGYYIQLVVDGNVIDELRILIKGDTNPDTILDVIDYTLIRLHILDIAKLTGISLEVADVNDDGVIDVLDYTYVRLHILDIMSLYETK